MTNITQFTPGGNTPRTHGHTTEGRRGMEDRIADQEQADFLRGYEAGKRRTEVSQSIVDFATIACAVAFGAFGGMVLTIFNL